MKVTVIATGFPTDMPKRSLFQIHQKASEPTITSSKEDSIQTSNKDSNKDVSQDYIKKADKVETIEDDLFIDDTDDWSTVPAFLRRNKK